MINSGIVRCVDELGRATIPKELRRTLGIGDRDAVEFLVDDGGEIILRKYERGCAFCGEINQVINFKGKLVCKGCIEEL